MSKKYSAIVKIGAEKFAKWRFDNLVKFVRFLDERHSDWRWFNVFDNDKKSPTYRTQIANYTRNKRP